MDNFNKFEQRGGNHLQNVEKLRPSTGKLHISLKKLQYVTLVIALLVSLPNIANAQVDTTKSPLQQPTKEAPLPPNNELTPLSNEKKEHMDSLFNKALESLKELDNKDPKTLEYYARYDDIDFLDRHTVYIGEATEDIKAVGPTVVIEARGTIEADHQRCTDSEYEAKYVFYKNKEGKYERFSYMLENGRITRSPHNETFYDERAFNYALMSITQYIEEHKKNK